MSYLLTRSLTGTALRKSELLIYALLYPAKLSESSEDDRRLNWGFYLLRLMLERNFLAYATICVFSRQVRDLGSYFQEKDPSFNSPISTSFLLRIPFCPLAVHSI